MSRPFSYNDENFTVIGNMLFVHIADTTAFTIPREVMSRVMKTDYGKFVVTNSIPCLRVVLEDGTISSAKVTSDGVVTLTAPATGKLIIDGTLDIECNY
mgnify:CR=1 FL=1|jgi:hypothetical protein